MMAQPLVMAGTSPERAEQCMSCLQSAHSIQRVGPPKSGNEELTIIEEAPLPLQLSKEELAKMRQSMPDAWGSWGGDRRAPKKHAAHDNAAAAAIRAGRAVRAATAAARAAADVEACVESLIKKLEKEEAADQPTDQPASSTEEHQLRDAARRIREAEAAETVAAVQAEEEHYRHYIMKELTKKEVVLCCVRTQRAINYTAG